MQRVLCLVLGVSALVGCARLHDAWRFFATRCPADGPVRETRLAIHLEPIDLPHYYDDLRSMAEGFPVHELARAPARDGAFPIYQIGPFGRPGARRILVVAGVHGNEVAASLAAPRIVEDARRHPTDYEGCQLHLIAPANPVGLVNQSRYNAQGCDINRDFGSFRTPEARAIRAAFEQVAPALVLALHEGPQDGFYLIATSATPPSLAKAVVETVSSQGVVLSSSSHLGTGLREAGFEQEGPVRNLLKRIIRLHSLGVFADAHRVGTLSTESPWSSADVLSRVNSQVAAVRAACAAALHLPEGA